MVSGVFFWMEAGGYQLCDRRSQISARERAASANDASALPANCRNICLASANFPALKRLTPREKTAKSRDR